MRRRREGLTNRQRRALGWRRRGLFGSWYADLPRSDTKTDIRRPYANSEWVTAPIPKSGSSTLYRWCHAHQMVPGPYNGQFAFAVIRHPIDRWVAAMSLFADAQPGFTPDDAIYGLRNGIIARDEHSRPQSYWLDDRGFEWDAIVTLPSLNTLLIELDPDFDPGHFNAAEDRHLDFRQDLEGLLVRPDIDRLRDFYARDLGVFEGRD
jgi:hypothetical protein